MLTYIGLLIVTYRVLYIGLGAVALQNASCLRAVDREREVVPEELRRLSEGQAHEERSLADEIVGEDLHLGARVAHPIECERHEVPAVLAARAGILGVLVPLAELRRRTDHLARIVVVGRVELVAKRDVAERGALGEAGDRIFEHRISLCRSTSPLWRTRRLSLVRHSHRLGAQEYLDDGVVHLDPRALLRALVVSLGVERLITQWAILAIVKDIETEGAARVGGELL